jgi:hypothetical protein
MSRDDSVLKPASQNETSAPSVPDWLAHLRAQTPPLTTPSCICINVLIHLRGVVST